MPVKSAPLSLRVTPWWPNGYSWQTRDSEFFAHQDANGEKNAFASLSSKKKEKWSASLATKRCCRRQTCKRACLKINMTVFARFCSLDFSIPFCSLIKKVPVPLQRSDFLIRQANKEKLDESSAKIRLVQGPEFWYSASKISSRGLLAGLSYQGRRRSCATPTILKLSSKRWNYDWI